MAKGTRWLRNPLLQFVILGTALFFLFRLVRAPRSIEGQRIEITQAQIERLAEVFSLQWKRPPTEQELEGLVDSYIREEILYREALALGLDRDDTVIRRRLAQKLEFLAEDLAALAEPVPSELRQYFEENVDDYALPPRMSFSHIYFSVDRRGKEAAEKAARETLERIRRASPTPDEIAELGDPFMLQSHYGSRTDREVADLFGREFASALVELEPGSWQGPVPSSYGLHLVRLEALAEGRTPELAEVEARVKADFVDARRREANEAFLAKLKDRYEIVVEGE